jgi:hypothetical protein
MVRSLVDGQGGDGLAGGDLGSQALFWASEPPRVRAEAAIMAVESRGEATRLRPVSSRIRPRPR